MRLVLKARAKPIGFVSTHGGVKKKKVAPGKWVTVAVREGVYYRQVNAAAFVGARDRMLPKKFEAFVTKYPPEEYRKQGAKMYLSSSGKSGYAITKEGDLISVFSAPGAHEGSKMIPEAIGNGAKTLDCLGPVLPEIYKKYGFETYEVMEWNDDYAPPNWNYAEHDRPDVHLMKLGGERLRKSADAEERLIKLSEEYARLIFGNEEVDEALGKDRPTKLYVKTPKT